MSKIPIKAKKKILTLLKKNKRISTAEIEKILLRHKVSGDTDALQHSHRLHLAQRLMASIRDDDGKREILAVRNKDGSSDYIAINFCNDEKELRAIRHKIHGNISGTEKTAAKVGARLSKVQGFLNKLKVGGEI